MRVAQVLTQAAGGPVDHAVDVARTLAARGHDSHVVGPRCARTDEAVAHGVTWHDLEVRDKRDARGGLTTVRALRSLRADVVHGHDRRAGWLVRGGARALAPRCVYTLHGVPDSLADLVAGNVRGAPRRRRDALYYLHGERLVTRWSGGEVVVPSHAVADYARHHVGLPASRVHVVPNGVDPSRWAPPEAPRDQRPVATAVWAGSLEPVKRVPLLLDALAAVDGLRLVIVGDGPEAGEVRRRVDRLGLADRVELRGRVADVRAELARADLVVLASAAENLPMVLLQAMSCGLPVVATAVGGVGELVRPGTDGWLVPADDEAALAAALREAVVRRAALPAMGRAARERVRHGWTLDACVDGLLAVYGGRG